MEQPQLMPDESDTATPVVASKPGVYVGDGNEYDPFRPSVGVPLPIGTYVLNAAMGRGYYLARTANIPVPERIYGRSPAARIMSSYERRRAQGQSTGVWLNGEKGSGKTMLAADLAARVRALGRPTILVSQAMLGTDFNAVVSHIGDACFLFDEFEKVYDNEDKQNALLTLFAGQVVASNLYLVTTNRANQVSDAMRNRPSRMRYLIEYRGLPEDVVRDYVQQNLEDQAVADEMIRALSKITECNFDIMQTAVEEHNLHGGGVEDLLAIMNIDRGSKPTYKYSFRGSFMVKNKPVMCTANGTWNGDVTAIEAGDDDGDEAQISMDIHFDKPVKVGSTMEKSWRWHTHFAKEPLAWNPDGSVVAKIANDNVNGVVTLRADYGFSKYKQRF